MQPYLEKTLDLSRQYANCFPGYDHIADPLIDTADEGMKAESVRAIFSQLRDELVPLVMAISSQETASGEFAPLLGWLQENIYRHGRKFTANELVQHVTGGPLTIDPYMDYLRTKFGELYSL